MKLQKIIEVLERQSPPGAALSWDNVGLLVGGDPAEKEVRRIYITLDVTDRAIADAAEAECGLIVSHHPMLFSPMKKILETDFTGSRLYELIRRDIAVYAMHTNFDIYGMAQLAEKRLGLKHTSVLDVCEVPDGSEQGIGRVGDLGVTVTLLEYAQNIRGTFGISHVKVFGDKEAPVRRVAVCPGSGKSEIDAAVAAGADVLVTGDIDHHSGIDAVMKGIAIIDAGHYGIEHIFIEYMAEYLSEELKGEEIEIFTSPKEEPYWIV